MSFLNIFEIKKGDKDSVVEKLIEKSYPGSSFYVMIVLASIIASIGLIIDNLIVVIGSMLVAPLLYPIVFLGMSITMGDFGIIKRNLLIIGKMLIIGIMIGVFSAILLKPFAISEETGLFQEHMTLPIFYIAVCSGLAASFAMTRKQIEEFLPGVAVSIALLPPLIDIGVNLGLGNFNHSISSLQLFIVNITGIIFASMIIFSLMGFVAEKRFAAKTLGKEKTCLKKGSAEFDKKKK